MKWKSTLILVIAMWLAPAQGASHVAGKPTSTDVCIHYVTDSYYDVPSGPLVFPNFTAQRWTYIYVCPADINFTFCYQTPSSYPNGGAYECQSNISVDSKGGYDPSKTTPIKKNAPIISAAIIVKPKVTKKYYRTCSASDLACNKTLHKMNSCLWKNEACVIGAGGKQILP